MIEQIECLSAKLQPGSFADSKLSEERGVHIRDARAAQQVAWRLVGGIRRWPKRGSVEEPIWITMARMRVSYQTRPAESAKYSERAPVLKSKYRIGLPIAQQSSCDGRRGAHSRDFKDAREGNSVPHIIVGEAWCEPSGICRCCSKTGTDPREWTRRVIPGPAKR